MSGTTYHVRPVRNYDGLWGSWAWGLYVDGELYHVFDTEAEAWNDAERLEGYEQQNSVWTEADELRAEDDLARQETSWQTQDRERNQ